MIKRDQMSLFLAKQMANVCDNMLEMGFAVSVAIGDGLWKMGGFVVG